MDMFLKYGFDFILFGVAFFLQSRMSVKTAGLVGMNRMALMTVNQN